MPINQVLKVIVPSRETHLGAISVVLSTYSLHVLQYVLRDILHSLKMTQNLCMMTVLAVNSCRKSRFGCITATAVHTAADTALIKRTATAVYFGIVAIKRTATAVDGEQPPNDGQPNPQCRNP